MFNWKCSDKIESTINSIAGICSHCSPSHFSPIGQLINESIDCRLGDLSHRHSYTLSGQHVATIPVSASKIRATEAPNSNGLPSQMTKSLFVSVTFRLKIFSIFLDTKSTASLLPRPAYLAAQAASSGRLWIWESTVFCQLLCRDARSYACSPSPAIASPKVTPASVRTAATDFVNGGPTSSLLFSQVSGAPRFAVNITGMLAAASWSATYHSH